MAKPFERTKSPFFSSGPCKKHPFWPDHLSEIKGLSRSHRSHCGIAEIQAVIEDCKALLEIPEDYKIALVAGSATGAIEMLMWSLLGQRPLDLLVWDVFGKRWQDDLTHQLKEVETRILSSEHGTIPDLDQVKFDHDVMFLWNGSTAGVKVPHTDWIPDDRKGLSICDMTSGVFSMHIPWLKIDAAAFSWQKALGGEAAHGMIVLSPKAIERLETYTPSWPIPGIFRMRQDGKALEGIFQGLTLNTPSMLCISDFRFALKWAKSIGGLQGLVRKSEENLAILENWVSSIDDWEFLAREKSCRSNTTVCLCYKGDGFHEKTQEQQWQFYRAIGSMLAEEGIAYDMVNHASAVPALRIWCGPTIDSKDLSILTQWIDWSVKEINNS